MHLVAASRAACIVTARVHHPVQACGAPRVWPAPRRAAPTRRRAALVASSKGEGAAAAGQDLNFARVAAAIKRKLAHWAGDNSTKLDMLQSWLSEAKLGHSGESDAEHNQTETVAYEEGDRQGLEGMQLDVKSWLASPEQVEEADTKAAGVLIQRLLQAYHKQAGEAFDDEDEDTYWRLQGFVPGGLADELDHETLKRAIKAYLSIPFSGV
eukprot:scaffold2.g7054.t1